MTNSNLAPLADRYALLKADIEELTKELDKVRAEIKASGVERIIGERAIVEVALSERSSLDAKAVKEILSADQLASVTRVTLVETLRVKPNVKITTI
jgi:hypothetical protein